MTRINFLHCKTFSCGRNKDPLGDNKQVQIPRRLPPNDTDVSKFSATKVQEVIGRALDRIGTYSDLDHR